MGGSCNNHPIRDAVEDLKSIFCSDCCIGFSTGPTESELHAKKVAEELAEMKEKSEQSSTQKEQKIMDYINSSMKSFMTEIENINQQDFFGERLNVNTRAILEKNEQLNKQVVGSISTVVNTRLVQTDAELSAILEEKDEKKRKLNFANFVGRVEKQALDTLKSSIEKTVEEQSIMVSKEIKTRQREIDSRMEESIKELTEIMEIKEKSELELKKKQIFYMYQSALCDFLLEEVEG